MRWRPLLIVSVCFNLALIAAVWIYARKSGSTGAPVTISEPGAVQQHTNIVVRRQFFTWEQVESEDYVTYIANLRDIGCPEQTIRDIIIADVNTIYSRRRATELLTPDQQWWRATPDPAVVRALAQKLRELDGERRALLTKLLGPGWDPADIIVVPKTKSVALDGPVLGYLNDETKQRVNHVVADSQKRMERLVARAADEGRKPTAAELAQVREQTRLDLQKLLTPPQLEEFLLRYSQSANDLRAQLGQMKYFETSKDDFRALFHAHDKFDQQIAALAGSTDPNDVSLRRSLEQQREQVIKNALGAKRYEQYQLLQNPDYRAAYAQASAAGDPGSARTIYEVNQATEAEMARLRAGSNLTEQQLAIELKRVELEQLKATAQAVGQEVPPDPNAPPAPPDPPQPRSYTLRAGDTLGSLAAAYGLPVNAIIDANPGLQINSMKPGQRIVIPPQLPQPGP